MRWILTQLAKRFFIIILVVVISYALFYPIYKDIVKTSALEAASLRLHQLVSSGAKVENPDELYKTLVRDYLEAYGYFDPWYVQLGKYMYAMLTFNLPTSYSSYLEIGFVGRDTTRLIMQAIPRTLILLGPATAIAIVVGLWLGLYMAKRAGSAVEKPLFVFSLISHTTPSFYAGMALLYVFAYLLRVAPSGGMYSPNPPSDPLGFALDVARHMALPTATIIFVSVGSYALLFRSIFRGVLAEDYVWAARIRGLPERLVDRRYVIRPALPTLSYIFALNFAAVFGGAILTEVVFEWPGMGLLYFLAIQKLDIPLILSLVYVTTLIYVAALFISDIMMYVLDPRIRASER